jgi:SAM-dependent methyltransferase
MRFRRRSWYYVVPLLVGGALALLWVRATGGAIAETLGRARIAWIGAMLAVTAVWLFVRFIRWQFLLRRVGMRLPIRPTLASYLAALPGTATPGYVGEVLRAVFLRRRFGAPFRTALAVLVLERLYDVATLGAIAAIVGGRRGLEIGVSFVIVALVVGLALLPIARRAGIAREPLARLRAAITVAVALALSFGGWTSATMLYAMGAVALGQSVSPAAGASVFAESTLLGAVTLAPAGFFATGSIAIVRLTSLGLALDAAVSIVTLVRLTSTGAALTVGVVFLWRELRRQDDRPSGGVAHFDTIAEEYNAQWSPHVWDLLIDRKLSQMASALPDPPARAGRGLDLGCGLALQTAEMRRRGYDVFGVEPAFGLLAQRRHGDAPVLAGSALALPFRDGSIDFAFTIGVLHHLPGRDTQVAAFRELARVLKPGGLLLVHESNPRNPLFLFYMCYLFPILKSIDEGTEWWIDPRTMVERDGFLVQDVRYFTFLPDFTPRFLMGPALAIERMLERGPTKGFSAHYMAVLRRTTGDTREAT